MMSATLVRQMKRVIKERIPLAERVVRLVKPLPPETVGPIPRPPWMMEGNLRERLSLDYLFGNGLEIGALYNPVFVRPGIKVKYVDCVPVEELRRQLWLVPEYAEVPIVDLDMVDDGDTLASIPNQSQNFIIANHFLEHVQDPIGTIKRHLELLTPDGLLYYGIPDKRFTFDRPRPVTTLEHLYKDHEEGPAWSMLEHVHEYVRLAEKKTGMEAERRIEELLSLERLSIHFHVWTVNEVAELFTELRKRYQLPYDIETIVSNRAVIETLCVLRKTRDE